jgi:hypothetical protein
VVIRPWAVVWLGLHLALTVAVSCRDTFDIFGRAETIFPPRYQSRWRTAGEVASMVAAGNAATPTVIREPVQAYLHIAGIEAGFGFFAPNIPSNYKLVFELHHPDGRVDYDIPAVNSLSAGMRLAGLLDFIAETDFEELRVLMLRFLTESAWREHPDVKSINTLFGVAILPSPQEYKRGKRETYKVMAKYTFAFERISDPGKQN